MHKQKHLFEDFELIQSGTSWFYKKDLEYIVLLCGAMAMPKQQHLFNNSRETGFARSNSNIL
jgi:hypothetical protein